MVTFVCTKSGVEVRSSNVVESYSGADKFKSFISLFPNNNKKVLASLWKQLVFIFLTIKIVIHPSTIKQTSFLAGVLLLNQLFYWSVFQVTSIYPQLQKFQSHHHFSCTPIGQKPKWFLLPFVGLYSIRLVNLQCGWTGKWGLISSSFRYRGLFIIVGY